ncbi:MAG: hypothetical protein Q9163_001091 [Psora crenata]
MPNMTFTQHKRPRQWDKRDDAVIATNNSSITSKRSVERLYYPEPHFFRYFVKKHQRRSPLINRGYWLRMHAIDREIRQFLHESATRKKVVLNLGCGDPLPFQFLAHDRSLCRHAIFIDIDYPELIAKKAEIINSTPQLHELLDKFENDRIMSDVYVQSRQYYAIGCDLTDLNKLDALLKGVLDLSQRMLLCTAEVSVTYMDVEAADKLISWSACHDNVRFCLLEQFLPAGAEHPFAQRMIEHFHKLHTPLRSIVKYPKLQDQERRFHQRGWSSIVVQSLWDVWCHASFTSATQKKFVDGVEPFDEWEEFILYASHYFLLVATTEVTEALGISKPSGLKVVPTNTALAHDRSVKVPSTLTVKRSTLELPQTERRFGALFESSHGIFGFYGGLGTRSRSNSTVFVSEAIFTDVKASLHRTTVPKTSTQFALPSVVEPRMSHTITHLANGSFLLVGGRASPDRPLKDCWYFSNGWRRVQDLPKPLFRHCAASVVFGDNPLPTAAVLVCGGKSSNNTLSHSWLLWRELFGWQDVSTSKADIEPVFGASISSTRPGSGIMIGGMTEDHTINSDMWEWSLSTLDGYILLTLYKHSLHDPTASKVLGRLGSQLVPFLDGLLLIGGVCNDMLREKEEVVYISKTQFPNENWSITSVRWQASHSRSLLVGHSALGFRDQVLIAGGGAVCFSFGSFWNRMQILLSPDSRGAQSTKKQCTSSDKATDIDADTREPAPKKGLPSRREVSSGSDNSPASEEGQLHSAKPIDSASNPTASQSDRTVSRYSFVDASDFWKPDGTGEPMVFTEVNIGPCRTEWTPEGLKTKVGADRDVVVHQATGKHMDFLQKNFVYTKKSFGTFVDEITHGSKQYLRSLSTNKPLSIAANLTSDFPDLATDFILPPPLHNVYQDMHSSVLRISGPVIMWLHYDVMANILCQVTGSKRLLLYPPSDVTLFSIPPGSSSSSINCFDDDALSRHPSLALAHPREVMLHPGDVLYIPPLWLHTAFPMQAISVSINIFYRSLETGYAPGKDVYGNRDVQAYEKGRSDIQKIVKSFDKLPRDMARFYLERLANELRDNASQI